MRTCFIIVAAILVLASIFVSEYFVVESFYDNLRLNAENMKQSVQNGIINAEEANKIVKMWEDKKGKLYIYENHEYFKILEENVYNLKFAAEKSEQRNTLFALEKLIVIAEESEYDFALSFGNVF